MKRRTMLKRASALTGTIAVAGCLSEGAGSGGDETTTDEGDGGDGGDETTEETTTESKPMAVGSKSVETTNTGCGSGNEASVSFEETSAKVTGKVPASNPCHDAAFASVDLQDGELTVTMKVVEKDVDACQQCLGEISYSAGIVTSNGVPSKVTVKHDAQGETTTVAEQSQ